MAITLGTFETIDAIALPPLSGAGTVRIVFDVADNTLKVSQNGGAYVPIATGASSPWIEAAGNVSLVLATNTVSVGTSTAPAAGTEMSVQADVAPSVGPPSVVASLSVDAHVTPGIVTPLTGVGVGYRIENTAGTMTEIARFGAVITDVTLGAESASMGIFAMEAGAQFLCTTIGPGDLSLKDPGGEDRIQFRTDLGGTSPSIRMGGGGAPTDWEIQRIGVGVVALNGSTFNAPLNSSITFGVSDKLWSFIHDGTTLFATSAADTTPAATTSPLQLATGPARNGGVGAPPNSGAISISTGGTTNTGGGVSGNTGAIALGTGDALIGTGASSGNSGNFALLTGDSSTGDSGDIALSTGTAGGTRGSITHDALAVTFSEGSLTNLAVGNKDVADGIINAVFRVSKTYVGNANTTFTLPARAGGWRVVNAWINAGGAGGTCQVLRDSDATAITDAMIEGGANTLTYAATVDLAPTIASGALVRLTGSAAASGGTAFLDIEPL